MEEKELELIDYLNIIWKRKWVIIIGSLACMLITGFASYLMKPVYEVDAIIQPGKFIVENQARNLEEVVVEDPQQIADKVEHKSYDLLIAAHLSIDEEELPNLRAENIRNTLLTRIWLRDSDIPMAKQILQTLVDLVKQDIDKKIDIELNNVDTQIKENEIEKERGIQEIEILKKKLTIIEQRKRDISEEIKSVRGKIGELEHEQMRALKKENRTDIESLGLLLYSNEVQESIRYYDILNEKLRNERLAEEDVQSNLKEQMASNDKIDNRIANLKERKGRIDYTKIIKNPTPSISPISPKKKINVLTAFIVGVIAFTAVSFLVEYVHSKKRDQS